nr:uncharacterized protein LOC125980593 [Syngnathus scovelli]
MAARTDAAAYGSPRQCSFFLAYIFLFSLFGTLCTGNPKYTFHSLTDIGYQARIPISSDFHRKHNIPDEIARPPGSPWIVVGSGRRRRRRRERKQKRGRRSGLMLRLRKQPHKPPLPSLFLSNARSLLHKMDDLDLQLTGNHYVRDCCVIIITETWLRPDIPDASMQLASRSLLRADRTLDSGKRRGGGLCMYVHENWCNNATIVGSHCCPDLEYMAVRCRPFFLPRELAVVIVIAVYIPPDADVSTALSLLLRAVSEQQRAHPDGFHIVAGDFNKANLKTVLPNFHQHVKCASRGENTLDHVYTNIKHAYRAIPLPHLGQSDHLSLLLFPAYTPLRRKLRPTLRTITSWPEDALHKLKDCFQRTDWDLFDHQELGTHRDTVLGYIQFCASNVTVTKTIRVFPNQKPWMCSQVRSLLRARDTAFRSGDRALYSAARAELRRGVKRAKADHRQRIESHLSSNNGRKVWQGIQEITNFRGSAAQVEDQGAQLAEELNSFFARFGTSQQHSPVPALPPPPPSSDITPLTVQEHKVRKVLLTVNPRKAAGPDGVPGKVLRACAEELAPTFTTIFNRSLALATVPPCLKTSTIIPVPKKSAISSLNDYRPVALTPVIMKCFERLVLQHIKDYLPPHLDPHQFAYRTNRSTEDAIAVALHCAVNHLEQQQSYVRMLFVDYSSAFNTILPDRLTTKLDTLGLPSLTCAWINDFLTNRLQAVRVGSRLSSTRTLSIGSPQGCVLSPLLFRLYTHDCRPAHNHNRIVKFADDTTVVGLISNGDEVAYREEVLELVDWCSENNLALNTKKTNKLIIDFRRHSPEPTPLFINGERVERVHSTKYLGVHISDRISWSENITTIVKKAQQRLHFLRVLRRYNLNTDLLLTFYRSSIESLLTYCIVVWFGSSTAADREKLQRVVKAAQRIIGRPLPSLTDIYTTRCLSRAKAISADSSHPGSALFDLLPSGRRYRQMKTRTNRLRNSFFPQAIAALNSSRH